MQDQLLLQQHSQRPKVQHQALAAGSTHFSSYEPSHDSGAQANGINNHLGWGGQVRWWRSAKALFALLCLLCLRI